MVAVVAVVVLLGFSVGWSHEGRYHRDQSWSWVYHQEAFTAEQARAQGYVQGSECEPGMGYHYLKPEEAEAWFGGQAGGIQVLLYDETGLLAGVEFLFSAPSLEAPPIVGMEGPMAGHIPGMPVHYEKHIYFAEPLC